MVVKTHRLPADLAAISAARDAMRLLSDAGYPCPVPLSGPDETEGCVLTAETLLEGEAPDRQDPALRGLLAEGLARHVALLRQDPSLVDRAGSGPSWVRYQAGPWPVPHDSIVDFTSAAPGYQWIDDFGRRSAEQILAHRGEAPVVVGHADWYAGNTVLAGGALAGTFDWELVADGEAVIAGFAAAAYAASSTSNAGMSTPEQVAAFLQDYESARGTRLPEPERRAAAGAAAWTLAFNARWQVALPEHIRRDNAHVVTLVEHRQQDYLAVDW